MNGSNPAQVGAFGNSPFRMESESHLSLPLHIIYIPPPVRIRETGIPAR